MTQKTARPRINRGISLLSMAIVLMIVLTAAPIGVQRYASFLDEKEWAVMATHLSTVSQGATQYIRDNYNTLLTQVKEENVTVTGQTLLDKGYLPMGFALTNNRAQNYIVTITRHPTQTEKLVAFVLTTEGQTLPFKAQRYIAQNTSGLGGYIYPDNVANGASGGWQVSLTSMGLSGQEGHLVTYLTSDVLAGGAEESDRLYRFAVSGRPDLNRMHTSIDMNGNDISDAKNITAQSDIKSQDGWLITRSGKGWLNEEHGGGLYMDDDDWIKSVNGKGISTSGPIKGGTIHADERLSTGEYLQLDGVAVVDSPCTDRTLGLDNTGAVLTCQNGKWQGVSGRGYSRMATNALFMNAPGPYKNILVTVSSLFNGTDGSHTANALFNVSLNGQFIGTLYNQVIVRKGGNKGHSWVYQSYAVAQQMFTVPVHAGNQIAVTLASEDYHVSSDIRVDLTD